MALTRDLRAPTRPASCACTGALEETPALLTSTSTGPSSPKHARDRGLVGHVAGPALESGDDVLAARTRAEIAAPIPRLPPVTTTVAHARTASKRRSGIRRTSLPVLRLARAATGTAGSSPSSTPWSAAACSVQCGSHRCGRASAHRSARPGEDDRVDVVVAGDRADRDHRDARLVADPVGVRRLEGAPVGGLLVGRDLAGGDVDDVAAGLDQPARERDRVVAVEAALDPVGRADPHATSASRAGHTARHAANTSSGNFARSRAVLVVAHVGQRRQERRSAGSRAPCGSRAGRSPPRPPAASPPRTPSRTASMSARVISRGTWMTPGRYGSGDGAISGQLPSGSGWSSPSHSSCVEPLRPACPSWHADRRARVRVHEVDDPLPRARRARRGTARRSPA